LDHSETDHDPWSLMAEELAVGIRKPLAEKIIDTVFALDD
jgi:hypothetical protein